MVAACRGSQEGRRRPLSHRHRHTIIAVARQPEQHHAACVESRAPELHHPDICVFDLDPSVDDAAMLRAAALALRDLLDELGLPSWVKTSGSKGFHIVVPLDGKTDMGEVEPFAHTVGTLLVKRDPKNLTQEFHKADRGRRILVDTGRNGWSATHAAV